MTTLLNSGRPPLFCPGCSHEKVVHQLDRALVHMELSGEQVVIVSDIGCAGLFDTFFNTHALHGLHGRALTYAVGLKMARPQLTVVVVMGDGGLGIGGAHVLSSCRRNLDINLLVLNNFNYGMTGGQCSATTPIEANTSSHFLNRLEKPLDICRVAVAAGAPFVEKAIAGDGELVGKMVEAIRYPGFSLIEIQGICPGRFLKRNRLSPSTLKNELLGDPSATGVIAENQREEYGEHYRRCAAESPPAPTLSAIESVCLAPSAGERSEVLLLGAAGQYINTAGEILCLAGISGGLHVALKNDYPITVLRGHSISEVVFSRKSIDYTGMTRPSVVLCLAPEGVARRARLFGELDEKTLIISGSDLVLPESAARILPLDFEGLRIKKAERPLAALAALSREGIILDQEMLAAGITLRYRGERYEAAMRVLEKILS